MADNRYTSTYPSITDVLSPKLSNLVVVFGGTTGTTLQAVGFNVARVVRRHQRVPYATALAGEESLDFGKFGENGHANDDAVDDPGSDIFRIEENRENTIEELGFAVNNPGVLVGAAVGESEISALEGTARSRGFGPDDFESYGAVRSELTYTGNGDEQYPMPTTALSVTDQQGLVRVDSEESGANPFYFAFNNTTTGGVELDVYAIGTRYQVSLMDNPGLVDGIIAGEEPGRVVQHGGWGNTNPNLPRSWNNAMVDYTTTDLAEVL